MGCLVRAAVVATASNTANTTPSSSATPSPTPVPVYMSANCPGPGKASTTVYSTPNAVYDNYMNCAEVVLAPLGSTVVLAFATFVVEFSYDYLYIYDGENASMPLLGAFTGYTPPANIVSSTNSLFLLWQSDYSVTYAGFTVNISGTC